MSFCDIPDRCAVQFLQIFLKCAVKPSVVFGFPWVKWPQILLNLIWLCTKASQTFSRTLLNLTWLCTKTSQTFSARNPVKPDLALHQNLPNLLRKFSRNLVQPDQPFPEPYWIWPGSALKPPKPSPEPYKTWPGSATTSQTFSETFFGTFSGTFSGTLLNLTWLDTKAYWTCSGSVPASHTFPGFFSEALLNLTWICTKTSQTFSGTFSGTLLNVTWLCTKTSQTFSGTFGLFSGLSLNLTRHLQQCTPKLFWVKNTITLRSWGKTKSTPVSSKILQPNF